MIILDKLVGKVDTGVPVRGEILAKVLDSVVDLHPEQQPFVGKTSDMSAYRFLIGADSQRCGYCTQINLIFRNDMTYHTTHVGESSVVRSKGCAAITDALPLSEEDVEHHKRTVKDFADYVTEAYKEATTKDGGK